MKRFIIAIHLLVTITLSSCGSFGEGMMAGFGGYGGYGGFPMYSGGGGNLDYLLDPRYAMMQVSQEQAYLNQVNSALISTTVSQVTAEEDREYQEFSRYNKKPDGSNYTKDEWRAFKGQAIQQMNNGSSTSSSSSYSSSSSSKCAYCNNTGQIIIEQSVATYGYNNSKYCDICQKTTLSGYAHSHHSCKCGRPRTSGRIPTYNRFPW